MPPLCPRGVFPIPRLVPLPLCPRGVRRSPRGVLAARGALWAFSRPPPPHVSPLLGQRPCGLPRSRVTWDRRRQALPGRWRAGGRQSALRPHRFSPVRGVGQWGTRGVSPRGPTSTRGSPRGSLPRGGSRRRVRPVPPRTRPPTVATGTGTGGIRGVRAGPACPLPPLFRPGGFPVGTRWRGTLPGQRGRYQRQRGFLLPASPRTLRCQLSRPARVFPSPLPTLLPGRFPCPVRTI